MTTSKARLLMATLGGVAIACGAGAGVVSIQAGQAIAATPSVRIEASTVPEPPGAPSPESVASLFRDGDYQSPGRYLTPGGNESIMVSVRIRSGVVISASSVTEASSPTARQFQEQFRVAVADRVVSRPLASVSVSVVAGASLTSTGFNDALTQIRAEAER